MIGRNLPLALISVGLGLSCGPTSFDVGNTPKLEQAGFLAGGVCGDGDNNAGEECDDDNLLNGDGCSSECEVEPGWLCPPTGPSDGLCVQCGNGVAEVPPEGCDDGNTTNGDGCSSTCTIESGWTCSSPIGGTSTCTGCGDGIVQANEACDDGIHNGEFGMCNSSCQTQLPWHIASSQAATLTIAPAGTIGVLASSFDADETGDFDWADYATKTNFFDQTDMAGGRVGQLPAAVVVENPILFFDNSIDSTDGGLFHEAPFGEYEVFPGTFLLPAGSWAVSPVFGGTFAMDCDCGSLGSAPALGCFGDIGGNPIPDPTPACSEYFQPTCIPLAVPGQQLTLPGGQLAPREGGDKVKCERNCMIAGQPDPDCVPTPNVPPGTIPDNCLPNDGPQVDRICQLADMSGCLCEANPANGFCGMGNFGELDDKKCLVMGHEDNGCYEDVGADSLWGLDSLNLWFRCISNNPPEECQDFVIPAGTGGLLGNDERTALICSAQSVGGQAKCMVCSENSAGGLCLPAVSIPDGFPQRLTPRDDNPWKTPSTSEGRAAAHSQSEMRRIDPRLVPKLGDPVITSTGELALQAEDAAFPSRGVPFSFTRAYRSNSTRSGALGPGWAHAYEDRIEIISDPTNRDGMPKYCTVGLPTLPNCLVYHSMGGAQLFVREDDSPYWMSAAGGFDIISVTADLSALITARASSPRFANDQPPMTVYTMRSPGGIQRIFDISGVLLAITDDMGFGVALDWELRSTAATLAQGTWLNGEPVNVKQFNKIGGTQAWAEAYNESINRLSRLELKAAVDSYGRVFEFEYATWMKPNTQPDHEDTQRRRRLRAIRYLGDELVRYEHNDVVPSLSVETDPVFIPNPVLAITNDAYLTAAVRTGLNHPSLASGGEIRVDYEYPHDLFLDGGAFHENADGTWDSGAGEAIDAIFHNLGGAMTGCLSAASSSRPGFPTNTEDRCGLSWTKDGVNPAVVGGQVIAGGIENHWRAVADDIIRMRVGARSSLRATTRSTRRRRTTRGSWSSDTGPRRHRSPPSRWSSPSGMRSNKMVSCTIGSRRCRSFASERSTASA